METIHITRKQRQGAYIVSYKQEQQVLRGKYGRFIRQSLLTQDQTISLLLGCTVTLIAALGWILMTIFETQYPH